MEKFKVGDWVIDDSANKPEARKIIQIEGKALFITSASCFYSSNDFLRLATPEEIAKVAEEFVLPAKWCIKVTEENKNIIWKWAEFTFSCNTASHRYVSSDKTHFGGQYGTYDYTEITFDQFKKYVLKEKVIDKEELLREARKRYPVGTKFDNHNLGYTCTQTIIKQDFYVLDDLSEVSANKDSTDGTGSYTIYKNDKWAKIVQDTLGVEDLVENEIYVTSYPNQGNYIFKYQSRGYEPWINDKSKLYHLNYSNIRPINGFTEFKVAQFSDRQWLEKCIEADKFIPKEEALKSKEMKFEVGKWYKCSCNNNFYRYKSHTKDKFINDAVINFYDSQENGVGYIERLKTDTCLEYFNPDAICSDSEIKSYLPTNYNNTVSNEWWKTLKKGDVVRCIANPGKVVSRKVGQEYIVQEDFKGSIEYTYYHASTDFEDWKLVKRANEVEKWSVGTYVVFKIKKLNHSKGEIGRIVSKDTTTFDLEDEKRIGYTSAYAEDLEWFPNLQEAQAFAKSLVKEEKYKIDDATCHECNGEGKVMVAKLYPSGHTEVWETCETCSGEGYIEEEKEHEKHDFKQASDVSAWLHGEEYVKKFNWNGLTIKSHLSSIFTKEIDDDKVQLPKFVLNKDYTNYFEKELEN
jgi:hypothetical protein